MGFWDSLFNAEVFSKKTNDKYIPSDKQGSSLVPNFSEEFSEETSTDIYDNNFVSYSDRGVQLREETNTLRLNYKGILAQNNAPEIYARIGYGNNLNWEDVEEYPMHNMGGNTFELIFPVKRSGNINIAFRDGSGNWDNNAGINYTYNDQSYRGSH
ncbi:MAG: carbohydrate-binding protein [Clostridiales bacterium]|jgi:hypothetical protein|nr:carbohydrate-binding protein [Eubacteriales bacterium]MDH7565805.1 carbohydrate-binding protein [Clostridiales bacterium]